MEKRGAGLGIVCLAIFLVSRELFGLFSQRQGPRSCSVEVIARLSPQV